MMFKASLSKKSRKTLQSLRNMNAGLLTNQSAFGWENLYHFEKLKEFLNLKTIFLPEHGLFAELQDQVSGDSLTYNFEGIQIENLYGNEENSLFVKDHSLKNLDLIVIDIRDVGSRYYTFLTTALYLLQKLSDFNQSNSKIRVLIIDSPNPIGRKIEGTPLQEKYESFVGVKNIPHRHGLTVAELLTFYNHEYDLKLTIDIIFHGEVYAEKDKECFWIPPSPNIPTISTCFVYPGQCLIEGTNLSEGRGTTKPFEIFGAPFIKIENSTFIKEITSIQKDSFFLRPLLFIPTFHKYKEKTCGGFQLFIRDRTQFHSLLFTLHFLKTIQEFYPKNFEYLKGVYEFRSDRPAIELLAGDDILLSYINGQSSIKFLQEYLQHNERSWRKKIKNFLLYSKR